MTNSSTTETQNDKQSLTICCYGSSSSRTPQKYKSEAYELGSYLAKRNHVCVNGAGSFGCMGQMNQGAFDSGGKIVGVIHDMFLIDGGKPHDIFSSCLEQKKEGKKKSLLENSDDSRVQLLLASGDDLQERKKMLVRGADALVVLPGGPGTFDELWEMACGKGVGYCTLPLVCVNTGTYIF